MMSFRLMCWAACLAVPLLGLSCAAHPHAHGNITSLSVAKEKNWKACEHQVPESVCVQCHPERAAAFRERGDWCPPHDVPESQCLKCNPDLDFSPAEEPPKEADVVRIVKKGEDVASLEAHLVPGKFTVFDFGAEWCPPCRTVDEHLFAKIKARPDIAIRKLNVESWESPIAERWLRDVPELPLLIVYGPDRKKRGEVHGAKLAELDRLLEAKGTP